MREEYLNSYNSVKIISYKKSHNSVEIYVLRIGFDLVSLLNGKSTVVCYLMPNLSLKNNNGGII